MPVWELVTITVSGITTIGSGYLIWIIAGPKHYQFVKADLLCFAPQMYRNDHEFARKGVTTSSVYLRVTNITTKYYIVNVMYSAKPYLTREETRSYQLVTGDIGLDTTFAERGRMLFTRRIDNVFSRSDQLLMEGTGKVYFCTSIAGIVRGSIPQEEDPSAEWTTFSLEVTKLTITKEV